MRYIGILILSAAVRDNHTRTIFYKKKGLEMPPNMLNGRAIKSDIRVVNSNSLNESLADKENLMSLKQRNYLVQETYGVGKISSSSCADEFPDIFAFYFGQDIIERIFAICQIGEKLSLEAKKLVGDAVQIRLRNNQAQNHECGRIRCIAGIKRSRVATFIHIAKKHCAFS